MNSFGVITFIHHTRIIIYIDKQDSWHVANSLQPKAQVPKACDAGFPVALPRNLKPRYLKPVTQDFPLPTLPRYLKLRYPKPVSQDFPLPTQTRYLKPSYLKPVTQDLPLPRLNSISSNFN